MANTRLSDENVIEILGATNLESKETHTDDPIVKSRIRVTLDQLRPYDNNPRTTRNPKFDDILASIENAGLDQPPNISRRSKDDPHYMIIDGGNTRLEILNLLYEKYTRLAQQAESNERRLILTQKAESFFAIDCIFKPWVSESKALTGHMSENENRGDMLFIEKAIAVQKLRLLYETEDREKAQAEGHEFEDKPLSIRLLAERITTQGWTIHNSHISRYDYAANTLLRALPDAFWAGAGHHLVRQIRKYDVAYTKFWQSSETGKTNSDRIESLFLDTLRKYDGESVDLKGFLQDLNAQLGKRLDLHPSAVMAEVEAIMNGTITSPALQDPPSLSPEDLIRKYKNNAPTGVQRISGSLQSPAAHTGTGIRAEISGGKAQKKTSGDGPNIGHGQKKQTVVSAADDGTRSLENGGKIQDQLLRMVHALASHYDDIRIVEITPDQRAMGVTIIFGVAPLDRSFTPGQDEELATVWWALTKYSLSFLGDQSNRYAGFISVLKEQYGQYFKQQDGPLGTLLFFEEQILSCRPEIRDQLREIQRLCALMIQEIARNK